MEPPSSTEALMGTWHVIGTTFPMWLKGDKLKPRFTYSNHRKSPEGELALFDDTVTYEDGRGGVHKISGFDTQASKGEFVWKGYGWLFLFKSRWRIYCKDDYAVVTFEATCFTPEGMDIVSRNANMSFDECRRILDEAQGIQEIEPYKSQLVHLPSGAKII